MQNLGDFPASLGGGEVTKTIQYNMDYSNRAAIAAARGTHRVKVDAILARYWLSLNRNNRPLNQHKVLQYANRMKAGQWMINGQTLSFSDEAELLNGQHRLKAIVESECTVMLDVAFGISKEAFKTIDDAQGRTSSDVLAIANIPNYTNAASTVRLIMGLERNPAHESFSEQTRPSNADVEARYMAEEDVLAHWVRRSMVLWNESGRLLTPSQWAAYGYMMSKTNAQAAASFLEKLASGAELEKGSPILKLRNALQDARNNSSIRAYTRRYKRALFLKAWRYFLMGKSPKILKYDTVNETFPSF